MSPVEGEDAGCAMLRAIIGAIIAHLCEKCSSGMSLLCQMPRLRTASGLVRRAIDADGAQQHGVGVVDGAVYVIGGYGAGGITNAIEAFRRRGRD